MQTFREIEISGDAHQRGVMHGEQLSVEIAEAIAIYGSAFGLSESAVFEQAAHFSQVIADFNADYAAEIDGIAEGSGQDVRWITALNARTEILALKNLSTARVASNECTSMCFGAAPVLGQTWDWGQPLEVLCAMFRIERPDGHVIRMMSEPGIIGKIGMNSAGVGVCLNILTLVGYRLGGVPIHVMLRAILDCTSTAEAAAMIDSAAAGKSRNGIVADKTGDCFDREFAGPETMLPDRFNGNLIHTNHYLSREINGHDDPLFFNSRTRMARAMNRVSAAEEPTASAMIDILSDRTDNPFPIFREYLPDEEFGAVGTVATIVMDLAAGEMHVRKGSDPETGFKVYQA